MRYDANRLLRTDQVNEEQHASPLISSDNNAITYYSIFISDSVMSHSEKQTVAAEICATTKSSLNDIKRF